MGDTEKTTGANLHASLIDDAVWLIMLLCLLNYNYDKVADFSVGELLTFSDHCPLKLAINLPLERHRQFKKTFTNNVAHSLLQPVLE